jgi:uncharacterized membrane protein YhaH (DUF805 family)
MRDGLTKICLALLNFISVVLLCCYAGPPETRAHGFLRALFVMCYFITLMFISKGEDDENNRGEDDDMQDL